MLATFLKGAKGVSAPATGIQYVGGKTTAQAPTGNNSFNVNLTDLTGGLASSPAANDLVIVYYATGSSSDRDLVVSDYTEIVELYANDSIDTNLAVAFKFMGVTPDTQCTLGGTGSTTESAVIAVQVWRGVNQTTPFDVTQTTAVGINSLLCNPPAITPTTSGAIIVSGGAGAHNNQTATTYSSSDLTSFITQGAVSTTGFKPTMGIGYHVWTSGSFDPAQFTFSSTDSTAYSWAAVTLALRPA